MRIKRFGLAIIVLLFIVGATGCFKQESEKKITGYKVTKGIGTTTVIASEKLSGAEIALSGNISEKEILIPANLLKIVKYKDGNTIVSIAGDISSNTKMVEILSNTDITTVNTISEVKCNIGSKRAGETLLGDFDLSGAVDLADFQAFAQSYGTFKAQHDIAPASTGTGEWQNIYCYSTPDKLVDLTDFIIFAKNYGKTAPVVIASRSLEATKLLNYINSLKGTKTLSGEHEFNFDNMSYIGAVAGITGKYPAVYETELAMTAGESPARAVELRNYVVEKSIKWWNQGGIVALMWHECLPGSDIQDFAHSQAKCTQEEFNQIVTPGTANYNLLIAEIDEIAVYLKKLKDANVPVLWRPYHEMNGGWFWWGTKTNYTALWNILYDRLTNYHNLNNLIWVFSPNARTYPEIQPYSQFYPGHSKVDILSEDAYVGNNTEFKQVWQDELVTLGAGKPVAWSEVGVLPTAAQLNGMYSNSIWFSCWRQYLTDSNTCTQIADLYSDPRVITRDEVPRLYADSYVPITYPPGPTPVLPPAGNIVKNPGFESGTTSWGVGKVYTLDTTDKHSGNNSIKLMGNSTWDNLLQYAVPCLPQTNYTVSFWAKSMTNLTTLRIYNADWTARIVQIDTTPNGVWTKYSAKFNSMYLTGLMIDFKDSSTGITFIDDIEIIPSDTPQITLPVAPSDLTATAASTTQINLSWKDNANNETGFNIENSTNGVDFVNIATVGSDITAYSSINLQSNTTYYFRVTAFNGAGNSGLSNVVSAKTGQPNTQFAKYEAENGVLTGIEKLTTLAGFSGTGYVGGFDVASDTLTINVTAEDANYNLILGYASPSTVKSCGLLVNNVNLGNKTLPLSTVFTELSLGKVKLNAGNNQITISSGWGWYYIDYITIEKDTQTPVASLSSIAVTKQPTKLSYNIGEALIDLTGMVVTGTYSDNTTKAETVTNGAISGFSTTTAGAKTITVNIGGKTTTFSITVVNPVTYATIEANNANIQYYGRWNFATPTAPRINWGDAYIETKFQGTSIGFKIGDTWNWYGYSIDGGEFVKFQMTGTVYRVSGLTDTTHTLTLIRRSEGGVATVFNGFELNSGKTLVTPNPRPVRKLEFVGDSITVGLNNEGTVGVASTAASQNSYMAFGPQLARLLNAEHREIGISGISVCLPNGRHIIDDYPKMETTAWDFTQWQPDAVIMLMGANDISGGVLQSPAATFQTEYTAMLDLLRAKNPNAYIICLVPINLSSQFLTLITNTVAAKNDSKIKIIDVNADGVVIPSADFADFSHPLVSGHTKLANYLMPKVSAILGWDGSTPSLSSIAVTKQPTKTSYNVGDSTLELTGLEVTGTYSNGTTKIEAVTQNSISGFSTTTAGTKTITVTIGTKTTTFTVNVANVVVTKAIIIDHTSTDLSKVPSTWITNAKQVLKIGYGHASHGSQIITGMKAMKGATGSLLDYTISSSGYNANYFMNDYGFAGATDLGNPNRTQWEVATRNVLNTAGCNRNVVMWSWCGQANTGNPADITLYLDLMKKLEADYPNIKFVYMTGHLAGSGATGNLNLRNQQIRDYCIANNKILYDFADIESYDPDGITNYMALKANDGCDYDSDNNGSLDKNWATSWVAANPNHELTKLAALSGTPAHTQNLNGILKARAFWWLAARLAGWDGK